MYTVNHTTTTAVCIYMYVTPPLCTHTGNIRVFCRVRPILPDEIDSSEGRSSTGSNSGTVSKPSSPQRSHLSIDFPDKETDETKIGLKFNCGEQVCVKSLRDCLRKKITKPTSSDMP